MHMVDHDAFSFNFIWKSQPVTAKVLPQWTQQPIPCDFANILIFQSWLCWTSPSSWQIFSQLTYTSQSLYDLPTPVANLCLTVVASLTEDWVDSLPWQKASQRSSQASQPGLWLSLFGGFPFAQITAYSWPLNRNMMHESLQSTLIFSGTFEGMQFGVCISEMSCDVTGSGSQVVLAQELCRTAKHSLWKPSRISATGPAHSVARPATQVPNLKNFSCSTFRLDLHLWQKAIAPDAAGPVHLWVHWKPFKSEPPAGLRRESNTLSTS